MKTYISKSTHITALICIVLCTSL